jgi:hypothetical protein
MPLLCDQRLYETSRHRPVESDGDFGDCGLPRTLTIVRMSPGALPGTVTGRCSTTSMRSDERDHLGSVALERLDGVVDRVPRHGHAAPGDSQLVKFREPLHVGVGVEVVACR